MADLTADERISRMENAIAQLAAKHSDSYPSSLLHYPDLAALVGEYREAHPPGTSRVINLNELPDE